MNIRFDEQTVLVTGAGHGIGRGIADAFAALGARVVATDISGEAGTIRLDVTDCAAFAGLVAEIGTVNVLVHSAGGVQGQVGVSAEDVPEADWHSILGVNLTGAFWAAQAVIPGMKQVRRGRIITISSGAGLGISLTGIQAYAAAKAGEIGLTRQLAHELGPHGITVNSVAPGFERSNPTTERQWESYGAEGQRRLIELIALRRTGKVSEIVDAVLFLASDHASWITGQCLSVDGGK